MASRYGREIGLLRSLAQGMEIRPGMLSHQITHEFLRREQIALARLDGERLLVIRRSAGDAFTDLSECLVKRSPAMERGTIFANVRTELLRTIASYAGRDPSSIGDEDIASLYAHFDGWFGELAARRRVFVPCVISPWAAPRFSIGPVIFVHIDEAVRSEFYPPVEDMLGRDGFDRMLGLMRDNRANWLACVSVEGCEHQRAEEIGALAADLAIVALQLAVPLAWGRERWDAWMPVAALPNGGHFQKQAATTMLAGPRQRLDFRLEQARWLTSSRRQLRRSPRPGAVLCRLRAVSFDSPT